MSVEVYQVVGGKVHFDTIRSCTPDTPPPVAAAMHPPPGCWCKATWRTDDVLMPAYCSKSPTSGRNICYTTSDSTCPGQFHSARSTVGARFVVCTTEQGTHNFVVDALANTVQRKHAASNTAFLLTFPSPQLHVTIGTNPYAWLLLMCFTVR